MKEHRFQKNTLLQTLLIPIVTFALACTEKVSAQIVEPSGNVVLLPEVTVIGSKEENLRLPSSGAYIDVEQLRKHNITDVNRALRAVPGVYVREEDGYGLFPNI
ncbi:hypothetical protein N9B94_04330, partial [Verrucomicrobia bacterium]|nr:hypothetical protein [Verrucomicrobiota bacterium]